MPRSDDLRLPAEIVPTSLGSAGGGISAAAGEFGSFLGALFVPHLPTAVNISGVMPGCRPSGSSSPRWRSEAQGPVPR
ncbi:MAG: hypothetical protein M0Z42_13375 [Actinomycetota bacterium]|nr:hypothetical protein [Actinomycetota bacterium]